MRRNIGMSEDPKDAKDKEADDARLILKMGINVDDGFVYFHEMLYRIMKAQFVTAKKVKFNKVMTVSELVTQFRIAELILKERIAKSSTKQAKEEAFFMQLSTQPVNLFLTKMFYKTSFFSWRNYMK